MKGKTRFPCTIMRGGTSKGVFLMEKDLPADSDLRDRLILSVFGSPDFRQIDGLGGADSLTSKLAIISSSEAPGQDIQYTFGAVGIDQPFVDYSANCGNISSAVGPYAIDKGLVRPVEPFTTVRIYNTNTKKMIYAKVPVKRGKVVADGDYEIAGCPGTGARIELTFMEPAGAATGQLLPTGNVVDEVRLDTGERYAVTILDAGNPTAFVRAEELDLAGDELPAEFDQNGAAQAKLEAIRRKVGELMGIAVSQSIPKISFVAPARDYRTVTGKAVVKGEVSLLARVIAMGKMHKVFAITAAIPAAIAAILPDSVVNRVVGGGLPVWDWGQVLGFEFQTALTPIPLKFKTQDPIPIPILIGHPSGVMDVKVNARFDKGGLRIVSCSVGRTARKILDGRVYVSGKIYDSNQ